MQKSRDIGITSKLFVLGVQSEAGQNLTEFCQENMMVTANTFPTTREMTLHGYHQMLNNETRMIMSLQLKMEKLYTVSKK